MIYVGFWEGVLPCIGENIFRRRYTCNVHAYTHRKKGTKNGAPGVLFLQMVPFFQRGTLFSLTPFYKSGTVSKQKKVEKQYPF